MEPIGSSSGSLPLVNINMENKALNIGGVLLLGTILAQASALDLSTGLDPSDTLITLGNTPDAHWSVDQPLGGIAPAWQGKKGKTSMKRHCVFTNTSTRRAKHTHSTGI